MRLAAYALTPHPHRRPTLVLFSVDGDVVDTGRSKRGSDAEARALSSARALPDGLPGSMAAAVGAVAAVANGGATNIGNVRIRTSEQHTGKEPIDCSYEMENR